MVIIGMEHSLVEIYRRVLENPGTDNRYLLVRRFLKDIDNSVELLSRVIGGEDTPDTVATMASPENVIAALVLNTVKKTGRKLRVIAPKEPVPGWDPLNLLIDELLEREIIEVYRVSFRPSGRNHARRIVRNVARIARGLSAKNVDVTEATAPVIAGLYAGGARRFLVLVYQGYIVSYQSFSFTA